MKYHFKGVELEKFDLIVSKSKSGFYNHYIIYLGADKFIHNTPFSGVSYSTGEEILKREIFKIERYDLTAIQKADIESRIKKVESFKYDLLNFNCEHFVNYVMFNKIRSEQYEKAVKKFNDFVDRLRNS